MQLPYDKKIQFDKRTRKVSVKNIISEQTCVKVRDVDCEKGLVLNAKEATLSVTESGCVLKDK